MQQAVQQTTQSRLGDHDLGEPECQECLDGIADTEPTTRRRNHPVPA